MDSLMEGRSTVMRREPTKSTTTCMPRLRGRRPATASAAATATATATPMSMLERFREAVLRLIMQSAASKSSRTHREETEMTARRAHCFPDSHRSEAVEDCIEFLKRSAEGEGVKGSGIGEDDMELAKSYMALPVM